MLLFLFHCCFLAHAPTRSMWKAVLILLVVSVCFADGLVRMCALNGGQTNVKEPAHGKATMRLQTARGKVHSPIRRERRADKAWYA